jgi:hypothetical protein
MIHLRNKIRLKKADSWLLIFWIIWEEQQIHKMIKHISKNVSDKLLNNKIKVLQS